MRGWTPLLATTFTILSATAWADGSPLDVSRFDGRWAVTLTCPRSPDGALPFRFNFPAEVRGGVMHGENGVAGQPGSMTLDGKIGDDGAAVLDASGLTGMSAYNVDQTVRGVPYHHSVTAQFGSAAGSGHWVADRTCDFTFRRR
jgi:hypothetical protein